MTNEQLKQKAIQEAYGEHWEQVKSFVDNDGSIPYEVALWCSPNRETWDILPDGYYVTKSLAGISDNNGWTRIEQDGSNLPVDTTKRYIFGCLSDGLFMVNYAMGVGFKVDGIKIHFKSGEATHYRPVVEHPKPVY